MGKEVELQICSWWLSADCIGGVCKGVNCTDEELAGGGYTTMWVLCPEGRGRKEMDLRVEFEAAKEIYREAWGAEPADWESGG